MSTTHHGIVSAVYADDLGDQLVAAAVPGDTVLYVGDVADFDIEDGGKLLLGGVSLDYVGCDDDASTITLAVPLAAPAAVETRVDVWDDENSSKARIYKAVISDFDGFKQVNPLNAVVPEQRMSSLKEAMRPGKGESVTLIRDDDGTLTVDNIDGRTNALASMQYLQGGMTTRTAEDQAGVDIQGVDSGAPGVYAYDQAGAVTARIDALTGDATFIGELGTADPADPGIFMYSQRFSYKGAQHTIPTIQLNTGANRDQPSIQADSAGDGSGIWVYSGASAGQRESHLLADAGKVELAIERTADSTPDMGTFFVLANESLDISIAKGSSGGGYLHLANDSVIYQTDYQFGASNLAVVFIGNTTNFQLGYRDNSNGQIQGVWMSRGGDLVLSTTGGVDVQNPGNTAWKPIAASAFNVNSDPAIKEDVTDAPDALGIIRKAPAREFRYLGETKKTRRVGPMADDLPRKFVGRHPKDHPIAPDGQYVSLQDIAGLAWQGVAQLAEQNDELRAQVAALTERLDRLEEAGH